MLKSPLPFTEESQADAEWAVSQDLESWKQPVPDRPNRFSYAWPPSQSLQIQSGIC